MTQQSQKKWSVILNILLLINKSGDNSLGGLLIRVLLVKLVEGTRWREKDKWQHPQTLPMLQAVTSLHLES